MRVPPSSSPSPDRSRPSDRPRVHASSATVELDALGATSSAARALDALDPPPTLDLPPIVAILAAIAHPEPDLPALARSIAERHPDAATVCIATPVSSGQHHHLSMLALRIADGHAAILTDDQQRPEDLSIDHLASPQFHPPPPDHPSTTTHAAVLWADPRRVAPASLVERVALKAPDPWTLPLVGGLVPPSSQDLPAIVTASPNCPRPGDPTPASAACLLLKGHYDAGVILSHGCTPIGPLLRVTKAKRNLIIELDARPALTAAAAASHHALELTRTDTHLLLARAVGHRSPPRRDDFVLTPILDTDHPRGAIAAAANVSVGDIVQFHRPDPPAARTDLELLLQAQQLHGPPSASLVFSHHGPRAASPPPDELIRRAFSPAHPGEHLAKAGRHFAPSASVLPTLHCSAQGQFAPIAGRPRLTHHAVAALLLRDPDTQTTS